MRWGAVWIHQTKQQPPAMGVSELWILPPRSGVGQLLYSLDPVRTGFFIGQNKGKLCK
jgi:hypothetical protein